MKRRVLIVSLIFIAGIIIFAVLLIMLGEGAGRQVENPIARGNIGIPTERTLTFQDSSRLQKHVIAHWVRGKVTDWVDGEKVDLKNARTVLGCLIAGKRIEEMNAYLMAQKATGGPGSRWLLNPRGGYNFTTMAMTPVLWLFDDRPDLLYPETRMHVANNILTIQGSGFTRNVPYTGFQDSENHILMAEGSRYLKNRWLREHGNTDPEFDNAGNGVEEGLLTYLKEIHDYGLYEYNSAPYLGYTYSALLNLHAFGGGEIKIMAGNILDMINWQYALASYDFKHFPPYRRRFNRSFSPDIVDGYHTVMLKMWASMYDDSLNLQIGRAEHHALWAAMLPYRPADKTIEWVLKKPDHYFVKMGHGYNSCPEIYSGDKTYLLSAGGANQGRRSLVMAKPIVLFMDDDAAELEETFHMFGPGEKHTEWNNTGVYADFAVTKGQVHVPDGKQALLTANGWSIFTISEGIFLAAYSEKKLGIMAIVRAGNAEQAINAILLHNTDRSQLGNRFNHPNGNHLIYDIDAPKDTWVIQKVNDTEVDRKFDQWPFFDGNI